MGQRHKENPVDIVRTASLVSCLKPHMKIIISTSCSK